MMGNLIVWIVWFLAAGGCLATGVAVVSLRTGRMTILGQIDEDMGGGRTGGLWHTNGTADGRLAVADSFKGDVYLIDRRSGARTLPPGSPARLMASFSPAIPCVTATLTSGSSARWMRRAFS